MTNIQSKRISLGIIHHKNLQHWTSQTKNCICNRPIYIYIYMCVCVCVCVCDVHILEASYHLNKMIKDHRTLFFYGFFFLLYLSCLFLWIKFLWENDLPKVLFPNAFGYIDCSSSRRLSINFLVGILRFCFFLV